MDKVIFREEEVRDKVTSAVDKVSLPVIETIGPLGKNVLYESDKGTFELTNDGITIIRHIELEDPVENAVAELIKSGSLRTNQGAGDGTSTTVLFSRELWKLANNFITEGLSHKQIFKIYENVLSKLTNRLDKIKRTVTDDKVKLEVATISANNDSGVANIVVDAIGTAGLDGMVFLETSQDEKTTIEKQVGFRITPGMLYQNLYSDTSRPIMSYADIPVIMLDKKLYYAEEAEHILRVAMDVGFTSILIVAKDFIGDAPNTFIANHVKGTIQVAMAKVEDDITMDDLAVYLGGTIVSESGGRRVDSISKDDFVRSSRISLDPQKILITNDNPTKELDKRVKWLRSELEKNKEDGIMKRRIASLTNGIVTIKVGGRNAQEAREKAYRVEDAVNATRAAMRDGYLVGGGIALLQAFNSSDYKTDEELEVATVISKASINRIAKNAQIKIDWDRIDPKKNIGLNALTGEYEDLLLAGVVEPYKVTELALQNAISVAQMLTSIGTYILNDYERNDDKDK